MTMSRLVERGFVQRDDLGKQRIIYRLTDEGVERFLAECSALNELSKTP